MKNLFSATAAVSEKILFLTPPAKEARLEDRPSSVPAADARDLFVSARRELARSHRWENVLYLILALCYLFAAANFILACL